MANTDAVARFLAARREELAAELERLTAPPPAGSTVSFGKRIGDGTSEAVERMATTATARSLSASLEDIDRALVKIGEGSYGRCDDCGNEIEGARLEALPAAALCVDCSRGVVQPPHSGSAA